MKLTALVATTAALVSGAFAGWNFAPPPVGGVFICRDYSWGGPCTRLVLPLNMCVVLDAQWNNTISTLQPDPSIVATGFDDPICTGTGARWNITKEESTVAEQTFGNDKISAIMLTAA